MSDSFKRCPKCKEILPGYEVHICPACGEPLPGDSKTPPRKKIAPPPIKHQPGPPPAKVVHGRYGGFWVRLVATVIDVLVVQVLILPVFIPLRIALAVSSAEIPPDTIRDIAMLQNVVLVCLGYSIYEAVMESSAPQATVGKRVFGLKVTALDGHRISLLRAIGRHLAKYISSLIFLIGYVVAGFTLRKQALHDLIAKTLVQRT